MDWLKQPRRRRETTDLEIQGSNPCSDFTFFLALDAYGGAGKADCRSLVTFQNKHANLQHPERRRVARNWSQRHLEVLDTRSPRLLTIRRRPRRRPIIVPTSTTTTPPSLRQPPDTLQPQRYRHTQQRKALHPSVRVERKHFRDQQRPHQRERRSDDAAGRAERFLRAARRFRIAAPALRLQRDGGARHVVFCCAASTACSTAV